MRWAQEKFGAREGYTDYDRMLADADIDAVVDLAPIDAHGTCNLKAIQAGKHLYTEKPMATTMADADAIVEAARTAGVKLACAPPIILSPLHRKIQSLIQEGAIGKVAFARAHASHFGAAEFTGYSSDPTWFYRPGGGPIFDMGVYAIHKLTALMGPAKRVFAFSGIAVPERIVRCIVSCQS